jgi:hypothetical protein
MKRCNYQVKWLSDWSERSVMILLEGAASGADWLGPIRGEYMAARDCHAFLPEAETAALFVSVCAYGGYASIRGYYGSP